MKTWMAGTLTICGAVFLLATAWGVVNLLDSADRVVNQGRLMMESVRGTTMQVHRMAQDAVQNQKTLVGAIDTLSTGAAQAMDRIATSSAATLDRLAARLEKVADVLEEAVNRTSYGLEPVLREAAETARAVREVVIPEIKATIAEARSTVADVRPVLQESCAAVQDVRKGISGIAAETQGAVADLRPILGSTDFVVRQVGAIAESGAAVAKHYETKILHPSAWQKVKGVIGLIFAGVGLWTEAKLFF